MRNILLFVVDCARAEKTITELPFATRATERSASLPFVDWLMSEGTTWTNYTAVSSTTTPNFGTIFTGKLPGEHGITEHSRCVLRDDIPTLAEILSRRGYTCHAEVTGPLIPEAGLDAGFESYNYRPRTTYLHTGFSNHLRSLLATLRSPWFLVVHLWEAHAPYQNPPGFRGVDKGVTAHDRALSFIDETLFEVVKGAVSTETAIVYTADHGERLGADYALNAHLGGGELKVLEVYNEFLSRHKMDYDKWFQFASERLGEVYARIYAHNVVGHGFHLTEELVRVPLIIHAPGLTKSGEKKNQLASQQDLFGTLLDLADVPRPQDTNSLVNDGYHRDWVYVEANGSGGKQLSARCFLRGIKTPRWKYWYLEGSQEATSVLWDLARDPRETKSVFVQNEEVAQHLESIMGQIVSRFSGRQGNIARGNRAVVIESKMRELGYL